jgi:hypothetical protein
LTFEDDVAAVAKFGVTERQARFLVTVMRHSDSVFDLVSSTAIADALDRGTGRIESPTGGPSMRLRSKELARCVAHRGGGAFCPPLSAMGTEMGEEPWREATPVARRGPDPARVRGVAHATVPGVHCSALSWVSGTAGSTIQSVAWIAFRIDT